MNRKSFGALTLAAVMTAGCLNQDIASMREGKASAMASFAPAQMAMESQISDRAGRLQAEPTAANQPQQPKGDRKLIRNGE